MKIESKFAHIKIDSNLTPTLLGGGVAPMRSQVGMPTEAG